MKQSTKSLKAQNASHLETHDEIVGYDFQGDSLRSQSKLVTSDEIVGYDYCGWPLYPLRIISLLRTMGMSDDIIDQIPEDILTSTITTLEDDGMGYGVNEECIVNCAIDKNKNIVYLWRIPNVKKESKQSQSSKDKND